MSPNTTIVSQPTWEFSTAVGLVVVSLYVFMVVVVVRNGYKEWYMSPRLYVNFYKLAKAKESLSEKIAYQAVLYGFVIATCVLLLSLFYW
jgi:hypothetical protein